MSVSVPCETVRQWWPSTSVHLETGPGAESDAHGGPPNISLPASVWALEEWPRGRPEPRQLLQQPRHKQPWPPPKLYKCLQPASLAGQQGPPNTLRPTISCACFPKECCSSHYPTGVCSSPAGDLLQEDCGWQPQAPLPLAGISWTRWQAWIRKVY